MGGHDGRSMFFHVRPHSPKSSPRSEGLLPYPNREASLLKLLPVLRAKKYSRSRSSTLADLLCGGINKSAERVSVRLFREVPPQHWRRPGRGALPGREGGDIADAGGVSRGTATAAPELGHSVCTSLARPGRPNSPTSSLK